MVSSIVGTGVFVLPATIIGTGISSIIFLCICTFIFMGLAYLFSKVSSPFLIIKEMIPIKGFYQFISVSYWISTWAGSIIGIYEMSGAILTLLDISLCIQNRSICQLIIWSTFFGLQYLSFNNLNMVEAIMTFFKIICLVAVPIIFIYFGKIANIPIGCTNFFTVLPSMMWVFLGIESSCIFNKDLKSFLPIFIAIIIIFLIYLLNISGFLMVMNPDINLASPYASIFSTLFPYGGSCMALIVIILCSGSTHSWFSMSSSILQSLSRDGIVSEKISDSYGKCVFFSCIGLIPLCIYISNPNAQTVFNGILNYFAIITSVFYLSCTFSIARKLKIYYIGTFVFMSILLFFCYFVYNF